MREEGDEIADADPPQAGRPEPDTAKETAAAHGTGGDASTEPAPSAGTAPADEPRRTSVVETIEAPAVAERRAEALARQTQVDAMNAVPTADGGSRVIINTVGVDADEDDDESPDADPPAPPAHGNGHDTGHDPLALPAFLRRT